MQVFIKDSTGKAVIVECNSNYTVDALKLEIQNKTGISVTSQRLVFGGKQLEDGRALSDYGVLKESTVHFSQRQDPAQNDSVTKPQAREPDDGNTTPTVDRREGLVYDTLANTTRAEKMDSHDYDYKVPTPSVEQQPKAPNTPTHRYEIPELCILHYGDPIITLKGLSSDTTVEDLKDKLVKPSQMSQVKQTLSFNGKTLDDKSTLGQCGLYHNSVIRLTSSLPQRGNLQDLKSSLMQVTVDTTDYRAVYDIDCDLSDTVRSLKAAVWKRSGILENAQQLAFGDLALADDESTLESYGLERKSSISLKEQFIPQALETPPASPRSVSYSINVAYMGRTYVIDLLTSDTTVETLKARIDTASGLLAVDKQRLIFDGKVLKDRCTLADYNINAGNEVRLEERKPIKVNIVGVSGNTLTVSCDPDARVQELKNLIQNGFVQQPRLLFCGRELDNKSLLSDNGIKEDSKVYLTGFSQGQRNQPGNGRNIVFPLLAFLVTAPATYLSLPRCAAFISPDTILPPKVLISVALIVGALAGCGMKLYQESSQSLGPTT